MGYFLSVTAVVRTASLPRFVAANKFRIGEQDGVVITALGGSFQSSVLHGYRASRADVGNLRVHRIEEDARDQWILAELGGTAETTLPQLWYLLKKQGRGQEGFLAIGGYGNILYVRDSENILWALRVGWRMLDLGWGIDAYSIDIPLSWRAGNRVVSR